MPLLNIDCIGQNSEFFMGPKRASLKAILHFESTRLSSDFAYVVVLCHFNILQHFFKLMISAVYFFVVL